MHVGHLSLHDFRSYADAEVPLAPGVVAFLGPNGTGKTNLVEAIHYAATLSSHRVASDTPLVRAGAQSATVRLDVVRDGRHALVELEISPGRANRARLNRSPLPRARDVLGIVQTVLFAPEDLSLVKGDPSERRRFLDELLVARAPRFAGIRSDYDRVLRQRATLLKTAGLARRNGSASAAAGTLDVWDSHLARTGSELLAARLRLTGDLQPLVRARYDAVARAVDNTGGPADKGADMTYRPSLPVPDGVSQPAQLAEALFTEMSSRRSEELDRGVCLVGPHRDELHLEIGALPARGFASHGESWSLALALRLASYDLLNRDGSGPILILDDVFAELDSGRRDRLAELVTDADQVLITAAVPEDVPVALRAQRFDVGEKGLSRAD